ncbi:MAG: hypothetical protein ACLP4V_26955 [Methylocella sp.]
MRKVFDVVLEAWAGQPVELLDKQPVFLTMQSVRTMTADGTEIRNYVNGDQKLYRVLTEELKFDYVIRFRGNITVTSARRAKLAPLLPLLDSADALASCAAPL